MTDYNPYIIFLYFAEVILFGMFYSRPAFWGCSIFWAAAYCATVKGRRVYAMFVGLAVLFVAIAILNPLVSPGGKKILFTYLGGRPYTWEGLMFGMVTAGIFCSVLLWFSTYQEIMTREKLAYVFGRLFPAASLILTMSFRLIADYRKKIRKIESARRGIGKSAGKERGIKGGKNYLHSASAILSALSSWALENSIEEADSMKCRGYGTGTRTHFAPYAWKRRDFFMVIWLTVITTVILTSSGACLDMVCLTAYNLLLATPVTLSISEEVRWYILRSKI